MELGAATLRRSTLNSLFRAIHPRHGLVWTDGRNVFLSPVTISGESLKQSTHTKLGEFDLIQGLCWSCDFSGATGPWCYLCVTQYQKVSIWRVEGSTPNLKLKLVRKISKHPLPQGCVWNPVRDILAIVTAEQCNLYFRHSDKKSSLALPSPVGSGALKCVSWSDQGDKLYLATEYTVWLFHWSSIDTKIKEFRSHESILSRSGGSIITMVSIGQDYLLLTKELPLDKLCAQMDLSSDLDLDEAAKSPKDTLMNLSAGKQPSPESALLVLMASKGEALSVLSEEILNGLLVPDLLCYSLEGSLQMVVVGSNAQNVLQVFTISGLGGFTKQHNIILPDNEKPKGLSSSLASQSVFILVGSTKTADPAFLNTGTELEYRIKLNLTKLYPADANKQLGETAATSNQKINNTETKPLIVDLNPQLNTTTTLPKVVNKEPSELTVSDSHSNTSSKVTNTKSQMSVDVLQRECFPMAHIEHSSSQPQLLALENPVQLNSMLNSSKQSHDDSSESQPSSDEGSQLAAGDTKDLSLSGTLKSQNDVNKVRESGSTSNLDENESARWRNISQSDESSIHNHYNMEIDQRRSQDSQLLEENDCEESMESICVMLDRHETAIASLRRRIDTLTNMLEECHMISTNSYQDLRKPELASIHYTAPDGSTSLRKFLMDKGRLKLDVLKATFHAPFLVLILDDIPIVLTSNIDGYIPLKFEAEQTYYLICNGSNAQAPSELSSSQHNQVACSTGTSKQNNASQHKQNDSLPIYSSNDAELKAERLKAAIMNDKSGTAMRRLQALAADKARSDSSASTSSSHIGSIDLGPEPQKPPRKGLKNSRSTRGNEDEGNGGAFRDFAYAV